MESVSPSPRCSVYSDTACVHATCHLTCLPLRCAPLVVPYGATNSDRDAADFLQSTPEPSHGRSLHSPATIHGGGNRGAHTGWQIVIQNLKLNPIHILPGPPSMQGDGKRGAYSGMQMFVSNLKLRRRWYPPHCHFYERYSVFRPSFW